MSLRPRSLCGGAMYFISNRFRGPICLAFADWPPGLVTGLRRRDGRLMLAKGNNRKRRAEQRPGPAQRERLSVERNLLENYGRLDPASAKPQSLLYIFPGVLSQISP